MEVATQTFYYKWKNAPADQPAQALSVRGGRITGFDLKQEILNEMKSTDADADADVILELDSRPLGMDEVLTSGPVITVRRRAVVANRASVLTGKPAGPSTVMGGTSAVDFWLEKNKTQDGEHENEFEKLMHGEGAAAVASTGNAARRKVWCRVCNTNEHSTVNCPRQTYDADEPGAVQRVPRGMMPGTHVGQDTAIAFEFDAGVPRSEYVRIKADRKNKYAKVYCVNGRFYIRRSHVVKGGASERVVKAFSRSRVPRALRCMYVGCGRVAETAVAVSHALASAKSFCSSFDLSSPLGLQRYPSMSATHPFAFKQCSAPLPEFTKSRSSAAAATGGGSVDGAALAGIDEPQAAALPPSAPGRGGARPTTPVPLKEGCPAIYVVCSGCVNALLKSCGACGQGLSRASVTPLEDARAARSKVGAGGVGGGGDAFSSDSDDGSDKDSAVMTDEDEDGEEKEGVAAGSGRGVEESGAGDREVTKRAREGDDVPVVPAAKRGGAIGGETSITVDEKGGMEEASDQFARLCEPIVEGPPLRWFPMPPGIQTLPKDAWARWPTPSLGLGGRVVLVGGGFSGRV